MTLMILSNIGATLTLSLGLMAIISPKHTQDFVSIKAIGMEGVSEVRATYGGFFTGVSIYALWCQSTEVFLVVGLGWLSASLIRLVTLFTGSYSLKNIGAVVFEAVIGLLCSASILT